MRSEVWRALGNLVACLELNLKGNCTKACVSGEGTTLLNCCSFIAPLRNLQPVAKRMQTGHECPHPLDRCLNLMTQGAQGAANVVSISLCIGGVECLFCMHLFSKIYILVAVIPSGGFSAECYAYDSDAYWPKAHVIACALYYLGSSTGGNAQTWLEERSCEVV